MVTFQLWVGVVFLFSAGLLAGYNFQRFVRGRYFAEQHSEGATRGILGIIRWCWAIIWAASACFFFFLAVWLARFALSQ